MGKMRQKKVLLTGVSGLLGSNLAYCLKDRYEILGLYHNQPVSIPGIETRSADLRYKLHTESIIKQFNPDILLHAAAQANVDICEDDPQMAYEVNVQSTKNLVDILGGSPTKFIYISTDLVYDGVKGDFSEKDATGPRNYYAVTKLEGEKAVLLCAGALVLRTNFFGWGLFDKHSLAEWVIEELKSNRPIQGFKDAIFSSIYTFDMAELVDKIIVKNLSGIYNCASRTALSKYDFFVAVAKGAGLESSLILPASIEDVPLKAVRSKNLSLDVSQLSRDLGVQLPSIEESIAHFLKGVDRNYMKLITKRSVKGRYYPFLDNVPYGRQCLDDEDIKAVVEVLQTSNLSQGPKVEEFEKGLCKYTGAKYAVAVSSGTAALHIACLTAGLKEKDEFITSPNTFVASANCGVYCRAKPIFADIREDTYNIDPVEIKRKITLKTKAVIPVHFAGQICDMEEIKRIVQAKQAEYKEKIFIIEDSSHALGSVYKGTKAGSCVYSDMTVMSFHPVKHITTGEGGVVFTNDGKLYNALRLLRSHGITNDENELVFKEQAYGPSGLNPWYYEQQVLGFNYRITDIQCALGISQLRKIDYFLRRRRRIFEAYNNAFAYNEFITLPFESPDCFTNWHLYVLKIDFDALGKDRADIMKKLRGKKIGTQVHYIPVHTQPFYRKNFDTNWGDCLEAEKYYRQCLSLPLYPGLSDDNISFVVDSLEKLLNE